MKVSIITVCYNAEQTIEKTIQSVLSQSYANIEYIIIDGSSTDNTISVLNKYKTQIAKIVSEPDKGIYDAMNKGIRVATGDIIGIINADDWYEKDAVENVVNAFNNSDVELVYSKTKLIYFDSASTETAEVALERLWYDVGIMHPSVFIRKETYNRYGLFDLSYELAADYELFLRYYINKVKFLYIDKLLVNFTLGGKSTLEFAKGVGEVKKISLSYAHEYNGNEDIYELIENRYKEALFNMALQGPSSIIKDILDKKFMIENKGLYIWGTGYYGKYFSRILKVLEIPVQGYIDNNLKEIKNGNDIPIYNPKILSEGTYNIFIAVNGFSNEIAQQIESFQNKEIVYMTIPELKKEIYEICHN